MKIFAGTSGYSYKGWKGTFYPDDLPDRKMLRFYAEHFRTVEINNTFYRLPSEKLLQGWSEQVPDDFRFVIKASRRITHIKRLKEVDDALEYLLGNVQVLGAKLGPLFFQMPPTARKNLERLQAFLALVPDSIRVAFEFRHDSWFDDDVYDVLRSKNAALCIAETDELCRPRAVTADWGYLRLRRETYTDGDLALWAAFVKNQTWDSAFTFFKHEDKGDATKHAMRFTAALD